MARPPAVSPEVRQWAIDSVRAGATTREVAESLGVSHVAVAGWVKKAAPPPPAPAPAPAAPPPPADAAPLDTLATLRDQIAQAIALSNQARAVGNHAAATSALRQIGLMLPILARIEARMAESADSIRFSRSEIAAAEESVTARLKALAARDVRCAGCGRKLSAQWGMQDIHTERHEDHSETPRETRKRA